MDATDWRILTELQRDARISFSELGRRVSLTAPAVAERVRRLSERGVVEGFAARINLERVGLPILAFVMIRFPGSDFREYVRRLEGVHEIVECHHVTGDDCFIAKVAARSMRHLEEVVSGLARFGSTSTTVVYSTVIADRTVTHDLTREA
ncbi:Lrp/AsnC family transcriptional regulator [Actinomadura harenae]|uniref:Lrp/AsnC family transcriptional regulator n=1 Tax=Actinomadura harenae TaxID=2483351 RepID=A0A3M2LQG0_9ACTN|nr:Lrp/AsnC family transcriptional regulator [Actinomadura harenae]